MMHDLRPDGEIEKRSIFVNTILAKAKKRQVVIAVSGGIDSAVTLCILAKILPRKDIFAVSLPYKDQQTYFEEVVRAVHLPREQHIVCNIGKAVDAIQNEAGIQSSDTMRLGNIMARTRMIFLFDLAKKLDALVVGTENKSEYYLGYFTRFGDEASDIELLHDLYKTQVYQLAEYLQVPKSIISQAPSANLWENQTDEEEMGFSYKEADQVLYSHFENGMSTEELQKKFPNATKILKRVEENKFKHETPYVFRTYIVNLPR